MSEPRCERTDLLVTECAHCRGDDDSAIPGVKPQVQHEHTVSPGYQMSAHYRSRCASCGNQVKVGQQIVQTLTGWVCETCAEEENHL